MKKSNKYIFYAIGGLTVLGVVGYLIYKNRKSKTEKKSKTDNDTKTSTSANIPNVNLSNTPINSVNSGKDTNTSSNTSSNTPSNTSSNTPSNTSSSSSANTSTNTTLSSNPSTAKTIVEKAKQDSTGNINFDARGIKLIEKRISDFESLINDSVKDKDLSESMKRTLFSTFYRNLKSFRTGVSNDNFNQDTKNYGLNILNKFENFYRIYLPFSKYNQNTDWYLEAEKNMIKKWGDTTDFYNAKVI